MVRINDCGDMTLAVDCGRKAINKQIIKSYIHKLAVSMYKVITFRKKNMIL